MLNIRTQVTGKHRAWWTPCILFLVLFHASGSLVDVRRRPEVARRGLRRTAIGRCAAGPIDRRAVFDDGAREAKVTDLNTAVLVE